MSDLLSYLDYGFDLASTFATMKTGNDQYYLNVYNTKVQRGNYLDSSITDQENALQNANDLLDQAKLNVGVSRDNQILLKSQIGIFESKQEKYLKNAENEGRSLKGNVDTVIGMSAMDSSGSTRRIKKNIEYNVDEAIEEINKYTDSMVGTEGRMTFELINEKKQEELYTGQIHNLTGEGDGSENRIQDIKDRISELETKREDLGDPDDPDDPDNPDNHTRKNETEWDEDLLIIAGAAKIGGMIGGGPIGYGIGAIVGFFGAWFKEYGESKEWW